MKHNLLISANGLCTPPCGSSHRKSLSFQFRYSLLLLFLLMFVGNGQVWAESVTYNGTEFFYWNSHQYIGNDSWGSIYATSVTDRKMWLKFTNSSNNNVGYSGASVSNRPAHYWVGDGSEQPPYGILGAPAPAGTWTHVTVLRCWGNQTQVGETGRTYELQSGKNYLNESHSMAVFNGTPKFYLPGNSNLVGSNWQYNGNGTVYTGYAELELAAGNDYRFKLMPYKATSWDFCEANYNQFDQANSNITCTNPGENQIKFSLNKAATVRIAFDGQKITVNKVTPAPEPAENEYYVFGAGGKNWVTKWEKKVPEYKLTEEAGVYTKTFYNVQGPGLEFKVCDQNNNEFTWSNFNQTKSNFTCTQNGTNIDFNTTGTKNYQQYWDVTVHFDGTEIWVTRELSELGFSDNEFYVMGGGNKWTWNKNTQTDYNHLVKDGDVASISYPGINGNCSFKVFRASDQYEINWDYYSASKSTGTKMNNNGDDNIGRTFDGTKQLTIYFDGKNIWTDLSTPAITHTVMIHPNGGTAVDPLSVGDGQTISSISSTYGNGTAKWYKDEQLTQEFILGTSTVTSDMHLYAKWGVSGNYYFASSLQTASNAGETGNWNSGWAKQLNYASGTPGKCSYSFIAPAGRLPFELLTSTSGWNSIGVNDNLINNDASDVTVATLGGHFYFELSAPKKVTVSYDGKVSVNVEDYVFDNSKTWHVKTSWASSEGGNWNYNTVLTNSTNGGSVVLPVEAGDHSFIISTKTKDDDALKVVGTETFNALYVDTSNPSSGFNWRMTNAKLEGSGNFDKQLPQADGNYWRNCAFHVNANCNIRISFDGGKIRCDILPKHTVTFNSNGGSEVAPQEVVDGQTAREPDAPRRDKYTFAGWKLGNALYDFATPVTDNIELVADWTYTPAHISSVSINYSSIYTWQGDATTYTLVPTLVPGDITDVTYIWSSSNNNVATVENGVITPQGKGTAIITCTATDYYSHPETATCTVVVEPCAKAPADVPSYSVTITGYNTSEGGNATLAGLWNESTDNNSPASMTITRLAFQKKDAGKTLYAYDESGTVKVKEDVSGDDVQWILIPVGESYTPSWNSGNACPLYYIKNKATGAYMHRGSLGVATGNSEWFYSVTNTNATNTATDDYKWFFVYENENQRCIYVKSGIGGEKKSSYKLHTSNQYNNCTDTYAPKPMLPVGRTADINDYAKSYNNTSDFNYDTYPNPAYIHSQMNTSYYRMKENATVRANLASPFAKADVINVNLYADAATTVTLCKTNGDVVATISLNADEVTNYSYLVIEGTPLYNQSAFIIKAADNHAGIASITVRPMVAAHPATPDLHWTTTPVKEHLLLGGHFTYTATSSDSQGAISYASGNTEIAQVDVQTGKVTPAGAGTTTISATIAADECHAARTISYEVSFLSLQDYINTVSVTNVTLPGDFTSENIVINKAITIDGGNHTIGDLTVELSGDLTLNSGLKVRDFTICAKAGNTSTPAASGQVHDAAHLNVSRNAYFLYTVDPSGRVQYGWYDFTVPFPVNVMTGIAGIDENSTLKEDFVNERDYAIMEYLGERKAQGQYPYQKFRGVMQPNQLYSITLDSRYNYNTVRFQKTADGDLVASNTVTLNEYTGSGTYNNLNGVGNGTLHRADADNLSVGFVQVYQSGDKTFLPVDRNQYSFVVGTAFMVQEAGTMTLSPATHENKLLAPSRQASAPATAIQIAREAQPFLSQGNDYFSDQLFISASETGGQAYTLGTDLAKAGNIGNVSVPQIWTNAYNTKLCVHEAQLINGEASYNLSIYAPAADTYTLTSQNIPADYSLYLTQNGTILTELNGTYTLDLNKGITTEYGLLLVETYKTPTGIEESGIKSQESGIRKILRNGVLYILHNGKVYNAQGAKVK